MIDTNVPEEAPGNGTYDQPSPPSSWLLDIGNYHFASNGDLQTTVSDFPVGDPFGHRDEVTIYGPGVDGAIGTLLGLGLRGDLAVLSSVALLDVPFAQLTEERDGVMTFEHGANLLFSVDSLEVTAPEPALAELAALAVAAALATRFSRQ